MTIYAIRNARDPYYAQFSIDVMDLVHIAPDDIGLDGVAEFSYRNTAMQSWWHLPKGDTIKGDAGLPDITVWVDSALILSPKASRLLADSLAPFGELLPVHIENQEYTLFNCLTFAEEDKAKTEFEYDGDIPLWLKSLDFAPAASEKLIFKSKMQKALTPFCNERFKEIIESFELKGLWFDEKLMETY